MQTSKKYHALLSALEKTSRTYQGAWSAFTKAQHHGMAAFAAYEAKERLQAAEQVAQHLAEHGEHVVYAALVAPACDYKNPAGAVTALCEAEKELLGIALVVYHTVVAAGERPYFLQQLMEKMEREKEEVAAVRSMIDGALDPEAQSLLNKKLLVKYTTFYA